MKITLKNLLSAVAIVLGVVLVHACVDKKEKKDGTVSSIPDCEITAPLDSLFSSMFHDDEPGAVVIVMRGDSIVYDRSFGLARMSPKERISDSTMMNACSLTKTFVTAAVLQLYADGKLSLDDPVSKYFPNFKRDVFDKVTLRHILTHTTGLPDRRPRNSDQWDTYLRLHSSAFGDGDDYVLYANEEEMVRFFESVDRLDWEPGSRYAYQEPPFILLGAVIEQVSGQTMEEYIYNNILPKAGITRASFFNPDIWLPNQAHGFIPAEGPEEKTHRSRDGKWDEFDFGESPFFASHPDHGLMINALEHVKWQRAFYSGNVIPKEYVDTAMCSYIKTRIDNTAYGYGMFVGQRPGFPYKGFHMSFNGGFSVIDGVFPEHGIYYTVLANRPDWKRLETGYKIDDILRSKGWI